MSLTIFNILLSLGLSGYITYIICINSYWHLFFISVFLVYPIFLILFAILLSILFIWSKFLNTKKEADVNNFYYWIVRNVNITLLYILKIRLHLSNFDKIPEDKKCLFIINHNSNFDPMIMMKVIYDATLICVSKPENFKIPLAGPFIYKAGFISINRDDPRKAIKSIIKASEVISSKGHICICPEGTRNKTDKPLLDFHPGSFKIACKAKCPIVVIDIKNTRLISKNVPFKASNIYLNVVKVLDYDDYKDLNTNEISQICYKAILKDFIK